MKKYKYIRCEDIENYDDWEIVKILLHEESQQYDMAVIMKKDKPVQNYIKLHEATNEQLIEELYKRLENKQ